MAWNLRILYESIVKQKGDIMENLPESDWEVFKEIRDELFEILCARINGKSSRILTQKGTQHEKYFKLNKHIRKADKIIDKCFNDFDRSTLSTKLITLGKEGVIKERYLELFSPSVKELFEKNGIRINSKKK